MSKEKGITSGETPCQNFVVDGSLIAVITTKGNYEMFYLYTVKDGVYTKTKYKAKSPIELEEYIEGYKEADSD